MKLIKLLSKRPTENVIPLLTFKPDAVLFAGVTYRDDKYDLEGIKRLLASRGLNDIEFTQMYLLDIMGSANLFEREVREGATVIDITGGGEKLIAAAGIVHERCPHVELSFDDISNVRQGPGISLTVAENALLHGGVAAYLSDFEYTEDFLCDLEKLWRLCFAGPVGYVHKRSAPQTWNRFSVTVSGIERDSKKEQLEKLSKYKVRTYLSELRKMGLVSFSSNRDGTLRDFRYKNEQVKAMVTKAGNLLEQKVYLAAKSFMGENDVKCGVSLKWNADSKAETYTENEIDVFVMRGCVPVFISCKNGKFDSEELYKLSAVAERFGSGCAKKILVASDIDGIADYRTVKYLKDRAREMGITVIGGVHRMSDAALEKQLRRAIYK